MTPLVLNEQSLEVFAKQTAHLFEQKETEENWSKFEEALVKLTAVTLGSNQLPSFAATIKTKLKNAIIQSVSSLLFDLICSF